MTTDPGSIGRPKTLAHHKRVYDQAAHLIRFGAWECDLGTEELTWTDGVYSLFDMSPDTRLRRAAIVDLYADESRPAMERMRAEVIRTGRSLALDAKIRTTRGEMRWMRLSIDLAREDGRPVRLFGAKQDITHERDKWEQLRHMAERDPLTGLANRALFDAHYREMVADDLNHGSIAALALVDLDHFKLINDGLGHTAGDECLRQVAMRLQRVFNDAVLLARIGGDEFAVLLRAPLGPAMIRRMLSQAVDILCTPIFWNGTPIDVGASIGATIVGGVRERTRTGFFAEADAALYAAKADGRRTARVFGDDPHGVIVPSRVRSRVA